MDRVMNKKPQTVNGVPQSRFNNAVDFLMYSCFKTTFEDGTDALVDRSMALAWNDATMQGALNSLIPKDDVVRKDAKERFHNKWTEREKGALLPKLINGFKEGDFDEWHESRCDDLVKDYGDEELFTFGNAQKWVNMTMKYLYLIASLALFYTSDKQNDSSQQYLTLVGSDVLSISDDLQVPVDSFIIGEVLRLLANKTSALEDENVDKTIADYLPILESRGTSNYRCIWDYKRPVERVIPWSKWTKEDYEKFRLKLPSLLKENGIEGDPIDWEGPAWISASKR